MDCSNHKKDILGVSDMKVLAEMIGDLHYEPLSELLDHLASKLYLDGIKDFHNGKTHLSAHLYEASHSIKGAYFRIAKAWKISKPFMEDKTTLK